MKETVYLALTPEGARSAVALARTTGCVVWVGSDGHSPEEHHQFCSEGIKHTLFDYPLADAEPDVVEDALSTVMEHHPNAIIWLQRLG